MLLIPIISLPTYMEVRACINSRIGQHPHVAKPELGPQLTQLVYSPTAFGFLVVVKERVYFSRLDGVIFYVGRSVTPFLRFVEIVDNTFQTHLVLR